MYRIGIFGSAQEEGAHIREIAAQIGKALAGRDCVIVTGACSGLPYIAAGRAAQLGGEVHGYSPAHDVEGQRRFTPNDDLSIYAQLHFLPAGLPSAENIEVAKKYRNVASTAGCDAGIIIAGGWGTLHEVCSLIDFGKVIGLALNTGGIADEVTALRDALQPTTGAEIISHSDPESLVQLLFERLDRRKAAS